ncbi:hypothetical protein PanWU01x14_091930, partial [Parasponia andersonii]
LAAATLLPLDPYATPCKRGLVESQISTSFTGVGALVAKNCFSEISATFTIFWLIACRPNSGHVTASTLKSLSPSPTSSKWLHGQIHF